MAWRNDCTKTGEIILKHSPIVKESTILPGISQNKVTRVDQELIKDQEEERIAWIRDDLEKDSCEVLEGFSSHQRGTN